MNNTIATKICALVTIVAAFAVPWQLVDANSSADAILNANVTTVTNTPITINSIAAIKTSGVANGTYNDGWKWVFDITIPNTNETRLTMRFSNWQPSGNVIVGMPIANNLRFYSEQSSNAFNQSTAIVITGSNINSNGMLLNGDLDSNASTRRVQVTAEMKIPVNSNIGSYSVNFNISTSAAVIVIPL